MIQEHLHIQTPGRSITDLSDEIQALVRNHQFKTGLCHVFCQHTSASLILCENADPTVRHDLEHFTRRLIPDGDPEYTHTLEGPDDMPAHIRTILSHSDLTIPISEGRLLLGTWQGIFLWEHRQHPHRRKIVVTLY